jgi:nucleotidyltransferase/DNA polymerase involved in DNA repair
LPRFGYDGLRAYELSHGHDDAQVQPWKEEPFLETEQVFLDPIVNRAHLDYHIEQLTHRLARPLAEQFQMAGALSLTITFETGQAVTRQRTLFEPAVNPSTLLLHLEALGRQIDWAAPIERVKVSAQGLCPTVGRQLALFRHEHEAQEAVQRALRRVQARYGADVVQQGRRLEPDSPLPERRAYLVPWGT